MRVNIVNFKEVVQKVESKSVSEQDVFDTFSNIQKGMCGLIETYPEDNSWSFRIHVGRLKGYSDMLYLEIMNKFINSGLSPLTLKTKSENHGGQNHYYIIATYKRGD